MAERSLLPDGTCAISSRISRFSRVRSPVGVEMEGQGLPKLQPVSGDLTRGAAVFASTCVRCHGAAGQGTALAPPLWGPRSYNVGAGMARINTAASFIHGLMPIDRAQQLTPQQAFDVATYINTRARPDFPAEAARLAARQKATRRGLPFFASSPRRTAPAASRVQAVTFLLTEWTPQASHHAIAVNVGPDGASLMQHGARMRPPANRSPERKERRCRMRSWLRSRPQC